MRHQSVILYILKKASSSEGAFVLEADMEGGKLIKWVHTPRCKECPKWNKAFKCCNLSRCIFPTKR